MPIKESSSELQGLLQEGRGWIQENRSGDSTSSILELISKNEKARKSLELRPMFALYGESQVGKSYLAKNALADDDGALKVWLGDQRLDFINEINPAGGGTEATGLVSRFTTIKQPISLQKFPVQLKLLSVLDIVIILTDSYYNDVERDKVEELNMAENISGNASELSPISVLDIVEMREYFNTHFQGMAILDRLSHAEFWSKTQARLDEISSSTDNLVKWFKVLWCDDRVMTLMFDKLITGLHALSYEKTCFTTVSSILRTGAAIVNVETTKSLMSDDDDDIEVSYNGLERSISASIVSALAREVILPVNPGLNDTKPFLKDADLVDFPGARSNQKFPAVDDKTGPICLLRGKVRYLFSSYTKNFEISNLLLCSKGENNEVPDLFLDVGKWVEKTVGGGVEDRASYINHRGCSPLLVVNTMFNKDLIHNSHEAKLEARLQTNFKKILHQYGQDWLDHWSGDNQPFTSLFFLRDFYYSGESFNHKSDDHGFINNENKLVSESDPKYPEQLNEIKQNFLQHPVVRTHCHDPEGVWGNVATPNNDGSESIITVLNKASQSSGIEINASNIAKGIQSEIVLFLNKYVEHSDAGEQINQANQSFSELERNFQSVFLNDVKMFVEVQKALIVDEIDACECYDSLMLNYNEGNDTEKIEIFKLQNPQLKSEMSYVERLNVLSDEWNTSHDEVKSQLNNTGIDLMEIFPDDTGGAVNGLVLQMVEHFTDKILSSESVSMNRLRDINLSNAVVNTLSEELSKGIKNRNLSELITNEVTLSETNTLFSNYDKDNVGAVFSRWWNEFMLSLNGRFYAAEDIVSLGIAHNVVPPIESIIDVFETALGDTLIDNTSTFEVAALTDRSEKWLESISNLYKSNTKFHSFDVETNNKLMGIIERVKNLNLEPS